jgi:hypothetical protein
MRVTTHRNPSTYSASPMSHRLVCSGPSYEPSQLSSRGPRYISNENIFGSCDRRNSPTSLGFAAAGHRPQLNDKSLIEGVFYLSLRCCNASSESKVVPRSNDQNADFRCARPLRSGPHGSPGSARLRARASRKRAGEDPHILQLAGNAGSPYTLGSDVFSQTKAVLDVVPSSHGQHLWCHARLLLDTT